MELLSLEIDRKDNISYNNMINILTNLQYDTITITLDTQNTNYDKIIYSIDNIDNKYDCIDFISGKINNIIKEYMIEECYKYLDKSYFYFEDNENILIKQNINEEVNNDIKTGLIFKNKIKEYLQDNTSLNINGFMKFRLKFISSYAQQIVEKCIDNYLIKKEYSNFINILKYFSEEDLENRENINIIYKNDKLQIYDDNMKKISIISNVEFSKDLEPSEIIYDESIINSIITISPKKIIMHLTKAYEGMDETSRNTIDIINKLFVDRIKFCTNCEYCKN